MSLPTGTATHRPYEFWWDPKIEEKMGTSQKTNQFFQENGAPHSNNSIQEQPTASDRKSAFSVTQTRHLSGKDKTTRETGNNLNSTTNAAWSAQTKKPKEVNNPSGTSENLSVPRPRSTYPSLTEAHGFQEEKSKK